MRKYFFDLFEYNNWANDRIILKLHEVNNDIRNKPIKILSHIISVQDSWLEIVKDTNRYNIFLWDEYSIQEIEVLSLKSHKNWIKFISKLSGKDFESTCKFKNSSGEVKSITYQDILQHVVNHSTYHRGQINQILRTNKIEPVKIDFIYYC